MTTNVENENDIYTITINGRIDTLTAPELEQIFKEIEPKANKLIFDMSGVEYISSAGIRVIVTIHKSMSSKDGFVLRELTNNVSTIIRLTGFDMILTIE